MKAEMTELVMPGDANHLGTCFGGKIMSWIDLCAAIAAQRLVGTVVTASVDGIEFKKPIKVGDVITIKASVNAVWKTSMEVGVTVLVESPMRKTETIFDPTVQRYRKLSSSKQACKAYLTFVAINEGGTQRDVSKYVDDWEDTHRSCCSHMYYTEVTDHTRRWEEAQERRRVRLKNRKR
jgi:acyl-CoA hydrolase